MVAYYHFLRSTWHKVQLRPLRQFTQMSTTWWCQQKNWGIANVVQLCPLGTMKDCTTFNGNLSLVVDIFQSGPKTDPQTDIDIHFTRMTKWERLWDKTVRPLFKTVHWPLWVYSDSHRVHHTFQKPSLRTQDQFWTRTPEVGIFIHTNYCLFFCSYASSTVSGTNLFSSGLSVFLVLKSFPWPFLVGCWIGSMEH